MRFNKRKHSKPDYRPCGHSGKNLAYADLSNVTKKLATKLANDTFIKVDGSNANTDVFATDSVILVKT